MVQLTKETGMFDAINPLAKDSGRSPKFVVYEKKNGWYFQLIAANGEPVATSEVYSSKDSAKRGCEAVRRAAADAEIVVEES